MTTNWTPETKIGGVALASALGTVIAAIASHKGVQISPEAAAAIVGFAGVAIGYIVPNQWKRLEPIEDADPKLAADYLDRFRNVLGEIDPIAPKEYEAIAQAAEVLMVEARREAGLG